MSQRYLLDGYNLIKQHPVLAHKGLREAREGLVKLVETYRPQGSLKNSVTIVFDGQEGIAQQDFYKTVKVVFSSNETADEKIKRMVAESPRKKEIVLVTDDRGLRFSLRPFGVRVMAVKEFFSKIRQKEETRAPGKTKVSSPGDEKFISKAREHEITKEFEKIWLKEDD